MCARHLLYKASRLGLLLHNNLLELLVIIFFFPKCNKRRSSRRYDTHYSVIKLNHSSRHRCPNRPLKDAHASRDKHRSETRRRTTRAIPVVEYYSNGPLNFPHCTPCIQTQSTNALPLLLQQKDICCNDGCKAW